ncbi:hypothetical protein F2P56_032855 [Juglans regia]|uniref:Uncharacterized protein n=1 Tax=Juglans regia TaxID=51240 RepID=A0A833WFK4_JUGRE|nr:hypothetical protein F2P56_032855 [Juglans regia]
MRRSLGLLLPIRSDPRFPMAPLRSLWLLLLLQLCSFFGYIQGPVGLQKSHGSGNPNPSNKHSSSRYQRSGSKRNPNGGQPFPVSLPYCQPSIPPVFHPTVSPSHIAVPGYVYPPSPGLFPSFETQALVPPVHGVDASRNIQPPSQVDPNAYVVNSFTRRPHMQEPVGHFNPAWHYQGAYNPVDNISLRQGIEPRAVRGPFFFSPSGWVHGWSKLPWTCICILCSYCTSRL